MPQAYLPGDTRQRIQDLIKNKKITQAELAEKVGLSESTLSRFLQGKTKNLGDGYIIKIAKLFHVSTDFLLGETDIPDRRNYDIEELGLSAESARHLYTGKVDAQMLNQLIENPKFPQLLRLLARYQDETMIAGMNAANQNLTFIRSLLLGQAKVYPEDADAAKQLAQDLNDLRVPAVAVDTDAIRTVFMQIVGDIKKNAESHVEESRAATAGILEAFRQTLTKGDQNFDLRSLTPETMVDAIMHFTEQGDFSLEDLSKLQAALLGMFKTATVSDHDK